MLISGTHQDITEAKLAEEALEDSFAQNALLQAVAVAANEARRLEEVLGQARSLVLLHDDWERARGSCPPPTGAASSAHVSEEDRGRRRREPETSARELDAGQPRVPRAGLGLGRRQADDRLPDHPRRRGLRGRHDHLGPAALPPRDDHLDGRAGGRPARAGRRARAGRAELAAARDAAMEASRQKSEFLATMSHEIRTPLNGVIGLNDLLLRTELDADQRRLADGVQVAGRALLGVINDILDFSKIEAGRLELEQVDFDLRPVVDAGRQLLAEAARAKGLELLVSCHPDVPEALAATRPGCGQVLANLGVQRGEVHRARRGRRARRRRQPAPTDGGPLLRGRGRATPASASARGRAPGCSTRSPRRTPRPPACTAAPASGWPSPARSSRRWAGRSACTSEPGGRQHVLVHGLLRAAAAAARTAGDERARGLLRGLRVLVVDDNEHNRLILEEQLAGAGAPRRAARPPPAALAAAAPRPRGGDPFDGSCWTCDAPRDGAGPRRGDPPRARPRRHPRAAC